MRVDAKQAANAWRRMTRTVAFRLPATADELRAQERRIARLVPPSARRSRHRRGGR